MRTIGVRDLKAHLSQVLREVQDGATVLVTDRGRVIAELRQPDAALPPKDRVERAMTRLAAAGVLRLAERSAVGYIVSPLSLPDGTGASLLDDTRDER